METYSTVEVLVEVQGHMIGEDGETRRADTVAFPPVLHSVYEMSGSCIQYGDGLSNASLLSHSTTYFVCG